MVKTRQLLCILLLCSLLVGRAALAQTTLTQIHDTVVNPDGTPFNGTAVITWNGFSGSSTAGAPPLSTSARIYSGVISVLLVPTTTAASSSFYQVVYYNTAGTVSWTETWQVPPSTTALTLSSVRTSTTEGTTGSSGSTGGGSGSTSSGGGGGVTSTGVQYATLPIAMNQVTGLSAALASINATVASLSSQMSSMALSSGIAGSTNSSFIDAEVPGGAMNGANSTYTLAQTPNPVNSVAVYRNGLLQSPGVDYSLSGSTVTFMPTSIPRATDVVTAYYRVPGLPALVTFVDAETPAGAIDGNNLSFTLANAPAPAAALKLFKNGVLLTQNADYTVSGSTITFANATVVPQSGDRLMASYRH